MPENGPKAAVTARARFVSGSPPPPCPPETVFQAAHPWGRTSERKGGRGPKSTSSPVQSSSLNEGYRARAHIDNETGHSSRRSLLSLSLSGHAPPPSSALRTASTSTCLGFWDRTMIQECTLCETLASLRTAEAGPRPAGPRGGWLGSKPGSGLGGDVHWGRQDSERQTGIQIGRPKNKNDRTSKRKANRLIDLHNFGRAVAHAIQPRRQPTGNRETGVWQKGMHGFG